MSTSSPAAMALAKQVGIAMFAVDTATKDTMGIEILSCEPGRAVLRMTVQELPLNGHKICQRENEATMADFVTIQMKLLHSHAQHGSAWLTR